MLKTTIELTFTKITFFDSVNEETKSMKEQGKLTVKECKTLIPEGTIFVTKAIEVDTFEVNTDELIALRLEEQQSLPLEEN